ncbi:MAG: 30S ribosomal protein S6, partial [Bacteroidota bacterium]|nr:30S ribosomal protein S6 [Bacteroidota bacterium]
IKNYETVFILNPVLPEPQVKDAVEKYKKILTDGKAEIVNEENWGLKSLAYPIAAKKSGFYFLIEFKAPSNLIKTLEVEFTRDENVLRFMTTVLNKYAVAYNEKRKKGAFKKAAEAPKKVERSDRTERNYRSSQRETA